MQISNNYKIKC